MDALLRGDLDAAALVRAHPPKLTNDHAQDELQAVSIRRSARSARRSSPRTSRR